MQTFLPLPDYCMSAQALDDKRLGKQRVEVKQILLALGVDIGEHKGDRRSSWANHPCVKMWKGYESELLCYGLECCAWWIHRGFNDSLMIQFLVALKRYTHKYPEQKPPAFLFNAEFNRSHQSNLVRKDRDYYGALFPNVPDDLPYLWPVQKENGEWQYISGLRREITIETENSRPKK